MDLFGRKARREVYSLQKRLLDKVVEVGLLEKKLESRKTVLGNLQERYNAKCLEVRRLEKDVEVGTCGSFLIDSTPGIIDRCERNTGHDGAHVYPSAKAGGR